jgi:hypothetical protein
MFVSMKVISAQVFYPHWRQATNENSHKPKEKAHLEPLGTS